VSEARTALGAIREHCLYCANGSWHEVEKCPVVKCPLYDWRFGKHPYMKRKPLSEAQAENLRRLHAAKSKDRIGGAQISQDEDSGGGEE